MTLSDVHDEVVDNSDVEIVGGTTVEPRFPVSAPTRLSKPPNHSKLEECGTIIDTMERL